jgi:hypothetical protein
MRQWTSNQNHVHALDTSRSLIEQINAHPTLPGLHDEERHPCLTGSGGHFQGPSCVVTSTGTGGQARY